MSDLPNPRDHQDQANADWLFQEDAKAPAAEPEPESPPGAGTSDGYDIEGLDPEEESVEPTSVTPPVPSRPVRSRVNSQSDAPTSSESELTSPQADDPWEDRRPKRTKPRPGTVDEVWTRWAEWGPDLTRVGIVGVVLLIPLYFALAAFQFGVAFLILVAGAGALGFLAYPLFITMERPIRITPEQALKDYYGALSHRKPHYRRMWLLLSSAGKQSHSFNSFSQFTDYWNQTLKAWNSAGSAGANPLVFSVEQFKSEKSAGLKEVDAKYAVRVQNTKQPDAEARSQLVTIRLVKGPDNMWYLDDGTMPPRKP